MDAPVFTRSLMEAAAVSSTLLLCLFSAESRRLTPTLPQPPLHHSSPPSSLSPPIIPFSHPSPLCTPVQVVLDFLEVQGLKEAVKQVQAAGRTAIVATPRVLKPDEERLVRLCATLCAAPLF